MTSSPRGALLAKIGAWLQFAQIVGFAVSLRVMSKTVAIPSNALPPGHAGNLANQNGAELSASMTGAFNYFLAGIGVAAFGLMLVIVAAMVFRYRASWFFWFLCLYGGAATLSYLFPLGLACVVYALLHKKEFPLDPPPVPGTLV